MVARMKLSKSLCSAEALQDVVSMILSAEKNGQYSNSLCRVIDIKIKYCAVLCDTAQSRRELRQQRSLMWCKSDCVDFCFDRTRSIRSPTNGVGQSVAQVDIGIDEVPDDQPEISVALERPYDLIGHKISSSRQGCLLGADDFLLDSGTRPPAARQSELSTPPTLLLFPRSAREEAQAPAAPPRSRLKSARPRRASGQKHLAAWKSKWMFSRTYRVTPFTNQNYHSVAPPSICGGAG